MSLKITNIKKPKHIDCFVIKRKWMHGDADAYTDDEVSFFSNRELLVEESFNFYKSLIRRSRQDLESKTILEMVKKYPEIYNDILISADRYSDGRQVGNDELLDTICDYFGFPSDSTSDHQYRARLLSTELEFYDLDGRSFSVEIIEHES